MERDLFSGIAYSKLDKQKYTKCHMFFMFTVDAELLSVCGEKEQNLRCLFVWYTGIMQTYYNEKVKPGQR